MGFRRHVKGKEYLGIGIYWRNSIRYVEDKELWANLNFKEKYELLGLLVEKVVYFGEKGEISVFYRENGMDIGTAKNGNQKQNIH